MVVLLILFHFHFYFAPFGLLIFCFLNYFHSLIFPSPINIHCHLFFFYPFDFTFVCPTEICAFSDASDNFAKINCQIIGASCDSIFVHREFALRERKQGGVAPLKIPLLADNTHEIAKKYGCYICKQGCTFRATYIIDPKGIVRHISINDTPVGRSVDEVMRLLQAFQFTDEHGDVCPSNWKPGRKAMKPKPGDPELKKYFEDELAKQK